MEFEEVYQKVFPRIHGYICLRIQPQMAADDVTQEVMIEAWKNWAKYHPQEGKPPETWFLGIAHHRVVDYWRKHKTHFHLDEELLEKTVSLEDRNNKIRDAHALLEKILNELTEDEQRLLALRYIDGLSHIEIATLYSKNASAIRKYFSRLEARLNEKFGSDWLSLNS